MNLHLGTHCTARHLGQHAPAMPQEQTLDSATNDYLVQVRASGRSPLTIASYRESLTLIENLLGPTVPLRAITADKLHAAVACMEVAGCRGSSRRSETTLNRHRSAYRMFFNWTFQTGRTSVNPALLLCRSRAESIPTVPITADEVAHFLSTIQLSSDPLRIRDEALFATYAFAGLRRTEALLLNITDFDARRRVLYVRNGKGKRSRTIPVTPRLNALLEKFCENRIAVTDTCAGRLFPGRSSHIGLTPRQVQRRFEYWRTAAGLRPMLTIHSFRAGFATRLHRHSRDVVLVSRALGHRDIRVTLRYLDMSARNLSKIIESTFG